MDQVKFTLQSVSKALIYAIALNELLARSRAEPAAARSCAFYAHLPCALLRLVHPGPDFIPLAWETRSPEIALRAPLRPPTPRTGQICGRGAPRRPSAARCQRRLRLAVGSN